MKEIKGIGTNSCCVVLLKSNSEGYMKEIGLPIMSATYAECADFIKRRVPAHRYYMGNDSYFWVNENNPRVMYGYMIRSSYYLIYK